MNAVKGGNNYSRPPNADDLWKHAFSARRRPVVPEQARAGHDGDRAAHLTNKMHHLIFIFSPFVRGKYLPSLARARLDQCDAGHWCFAQAQVYQTRIVWR